MNITLHLGLNEIDEDIPGVNSIVLIEPTLENVKKIGTSISKGCLSRCYLYLIGEIEKSDKDKIIGLLSQSCGHYASSIKKVQQVNLSYICLNSNLFSFGASLRYARVIWIDSRSTKGVQ